jgi:hypothetical protein
MFGNTRTLMTMAGAAGLAMAYSATPASAYIFDFKTVQEAVNPSGFRYSYWHAASSNGGKAGDIIAVFGDEPGGATNNTAVLISGTYNTASGIVTNLTMNIYEPSTPNVSLQTGVDPGAQVGTIVFNGAMGNLGSWNENNGATQGALNWTATFFGATANTNSVYSWLTATPTLSNGADGGGFTGVDNGNGTYSVSGAHYFNDTFYAGTGPTSNDPNSLDVDEGTDLLDPADNTAIMALWGGSLADPNARDGNNGYVHSNQNTTLGIDLKMTLDYGGGGTSIPETTSVALLGLGLVGLGVAARRRRK